MSKLPMDKKAEMPVELGEDDLERARGAGQLRVLTRSRTAKSVRAQQGRVVLDADQND